MRIEPPPNLLEMTEAQFQVEVINAAKWNGWLTIHIREMFGNPKGIPDLLCWRGIDREVRGDIVSGSGEIEFGFLQRGELIELKNEKGKISDGQYRWHQNAMAKGILVWVLRPRDWELVLDIFEGKADAERARRMRSWLG